MKHFPTSQPANVSLAKHTFIADQVENDIQWKLFKTGCVVLEEFQERYVTRKPPALETEIGGMKWFPYGDYFVEDPKRAEYVWELTKLLKHLIDIDPSILSAQVRSLFQKLQSSHCLTTTPFVSLMYQFKSCLMLICGQRLPRTICFISFLEIVPALIILSLYFCIA